MRFKTIDDFNVRGKTVLLRVDINSEINNGKPVLNDRIVEHGKTIAKLKRKGAKVVVLGHQGRPGKGLTSLSGHAKLLKIKFVKDIIGNKAVKAIRELNNGEAILLENVRKLKDEFNLRKGNKLVGILSGLCDVYINDAFSVVHRAQASITGIPNVMKEKGIGPVLEEELREIVKVKGKKNVLYILGGNKGDNIFLMRKPRVLTCGIWGQLCLIAKGQKLGAQDKFLKKEIKDVLPALRGKVKGVRTPMDFAVRAGGRRKELSVSDFPSRFEIFDIGEKTMKQYSELISRASAIFMKGTAGFTEDAKFSKGTFALLRAIEKSKGFGVVSGGHLGSALKKARIDRKRFGYVSLSGGALVHYLAGEKLPGLEALKGK
jgi:phosphoglycerate kinase